MEIISVKDGRIILDLFPEDAARLAQACRAASLDLFGFVVPMDYYGLPDTVSQASPQAAKVGRQYSIMPMALEGAALACVAHGWMLTKEADLLDIDNVRHFPAAAPSINLHPPRKAEEDKADKPDLDRTLQRLHERAAELFGEQGAFDLFAGVLSEPGEEGDDSDDSAGEVAA